MGRKAAFGQGNGAAGRPEVDLYVGLLLGHLRRAEGLSTADLAAALDAAHAEIEAYESGQATLSLRDIERIAAVLGFDARDLVQSIGEYVLADAADASSTPEARAARR